MEIKEFTKVIKDQQKACASVLVEKGAEYAVTADMLHNFKQAAGLQRVSLEQALGGMMMKHTTSIYDMIKANENFPMAKWDEKITDHINYLLLLKAVIVEEKNLQPKT